MRTKKTDRLVNGFFVSISLFFVLSAFFAEYIDKKIGGWTEESSIGRDYTKEFAERKAMFGKLMSLIHMVGKSCKDRETQEVYNLLKQSKLCYLDTAPHYDCKYSDTVLLGIQPLKRDEDFAYEITKGNNKKFVSVGGLYSQKFDIIVIRNVSQYSDLATALTAYHEGYHALLHQTHRSLFYEEGKEEAIVRGLELDIIKNMYGQPFESFLKKAEDGLTISKNGVSCSSLENADVVNLLSGLGIQKISQDEVSHWRSQLYYWIVIDLIDKKVWDKDRAMKIKTLMYYEMFGPRKY